MHEVSDSSDSTLTSEDVHIVVGDPFAEEGDEGQVFENTVGLAPETRSTRTDLAGPVKPARALTLKEAEWAKDVHFAEVEEWTELDSSAGSAEIAKKNSLKELLGRKGASLTFYRRVKRDTDLCDDAKDENDEKTFDVEITDSIPVEEEPISDIGLPRTSRRNSRRSASSMFPSQDAPRHEEIVAGKRRSSITAPIKPSMTGYLMKFGSKSHSLRRRFFVLTGSMLANYPLRQGGRDRIATWQLCLLGSQAHIDRSGAIVVYIRGEEIRFIADDHKASHEWAQAINVAATLEPARSHLCPMPCSSRVSRFMI